MKHTLYIHKLLTIVILPGSLHMPLFKLQRTNVIISRYKYLCVGQACHLEPYTMYPIDLLRAAIQIKLR